MMGILTNATSLARRLGVSIGVLDDSEEQIERLRERARIGRMAEELYLSDGYKQVLLPALLRIRDQITTDVLKHRREVSPLEGFERLMNELTRAIHSGQEAEKALRAKQKPDRRQHVG